MSVLDRLAAWLGYARPQAARASFAAAEMSRLTASLANETEFINRTLRYEARLLRARSRQAAQNNPYARRFAQMFVDNVCGPAPFQLQAKIRTNKGELNTQSNRQLEAAWRSWGRKGECEITGRHSWNAVQRLLARIWAIDGEILVRQLVGPQYGPHAYKLQIIDVDRLDDQKNESLKGGGAIHMGVEVDASNVPVAYWILKRRPRDWNSGYVRESERVPAGEIHHVFLSDAAEQVRGVPMMYAALLNLVHLGAFEEAAVIAARVGAAQMGVITSPDGNAPPIGQSTTAAGDPQLNAEPGAFPVLPPGYEMQAWNPKYPDAAIDPFAKHILRGIAAGLGTAYHNLSGNMEGVNYSSARIAELDERDTWVSLQNFLIEHLHQPIFDAWLPLQVSTGMLPSWNVARLEKARDVRWQGRRWAWVDPEKEANAAILAKDNQLKSRTRIVAETGEDLEDVFEEIAAERLMAEQMGIELSEDVAADAAEAAAGAPEGDGEDDEDAAESAERQVQMLREELASLFGQVEVIRQVLDRPLFGQGAISVNTPVTLAEGAVRNEISVPEREVHVAPAEVRNEVNVAPAQVVMAQPKRVVETIHRDENREMQRVVREVADE